MLRYTGPTPRTKLLRSVADSVHLDVVGVPVAAVVVVHGEDVGLLVTQDRRQALGRLFDIGLPE